MPKFTAGIPSAKILMCGIIIFMLIIFSETFIIVIRKQIYLVPILLISTIIGITASYLFIKKGYGIAGVSAGMSISYIVCFLIVTGFATRHFWKLREIVGFYKDIFIPYTYVLIVLFYIETLFIHKIGLAVMFKECFLYAILSIPIIILVNEKGYFKEIMSLFKK
jgi:O-antigen/teichoic acid export membrane protein